MTNYHALIVDDKRTNIDVLAMLLEREGVDFTAVTLPHQRDRRRPPAGFDGFLGKPLQATEFPKHLRPIMNGEPVWVY
jgi:hypothetical protein